MSARFAAKLGRACGAAAAVACFAGGAGGGAGLLAAVRVGLVDGAGGGTFLPVVV